MIIGVPTGVKIFNWMFTMYGGRIRFTTPVLWTIGFMVTFVFGGLTGVLLALPPVDWQVHNSLFLVAHFHHVIIPGVLFGAMAGYNYWFPKAFGFKLDERWGKASFWCWFIGFHLAFMPLYVVGLMGMTRRLQHYDVVAWQPWLWVAEVGAIVILAGIVCQVVQLAVSIRHREQLGTIQAIHGTGARWNGQPRRRRQLGILRHRRGSAKSTPFGRRSSVCLSRQELPAPQREYEPIEAPKNSPTGFVTAFFAVITASL